MSHRVRRWVSIGIGMLVVGVAPCAAAEGFLDLYAGKSYTKASPLEVDVPGSPTLVTPGDVPWDDTVVFGLRSGFFFPGVAKFIGLGIDFSYFQPSPVSEVEVHTMPITPMLLVRIPLLGSKSVPQGRLQPYGAIGPALVVTYVTTDLAPVKAVGFDVGVDARAGLRVMLTKEIGLYGEWRYTDVEVEAEVRSGGSGSIRSKFQTNAIAGGLTLSF